MTQYTEDQLFGNVFSQIKDYALAHGLTAEAVRRYFEVGICAASVLSGELIKGDRQARPLRVAPNAQHNPRQKAHRRIYEPNH